jgi:dipeptidase E
VTPTILAMGGGGFTTGLDPALDDFALSLTGAREPRVLFLPTASGDPAGQIQAFRERFGGRAVHADVLSLFRRQESSRSLAEIIGAQDLIYVGGGSLRNLLAIWRTHGLDECLHDAWQGGTVLAGLSAGAMCWFEGGVTKSFGAPTPAAGLGWLPGSLTVHADGEPERLPVWLEAVRSGDLPGGWAADDGVGLVFRGMSLERIVSSRPGTTCLRVDCVGGELVRDRSTPELLEVPSRRVVSDDVLELRDVLRRRR